MATGTKRQRTTENAGNEDIVIERREIIARIKPGMDGLPMMQAAFMAVNDWLGENLDGRQTPTVEWNYGPYRFTITTALTGIETVEIGADGYDQNDAYARE